MGNGEKNIKCKSYIIHNFPGLVIKFSNLNLLHKCTLIQDWVFRLGLSDWNSRTLAISQKFLIFWLHFLVWIILWTLWSSKKCGNHLRYQMSDATDYSRTVLRVLSQYPQLLEATSGWFWPKILGFCWVKHNSLGIRSSWVSLQVSRN